MIRLRTAPDPKPCFVDDDEVELGDAATERASEIVLEGFLAAKIELSGVEPGEKLEQMIALPLGRFRLPERQAEARHARDEVAVPVEDRLVQEVEQTVAVDECPSWSIMERAYAQVPVADHVARELPELLAPLLLDVLAGRDDERAEVRVPVAVEREHAEGDQRLPHADFVGEVCDAFALEDVVQRDSAVELPFGDVVRDPAGEVQQASGR
jgi:hypothetical protein